MIKKFERPQGSIENLSDLHAGDTIWHVYGVYPVQKISELKNISPVQTRENGYVHIDYEMSNGKIYYGRSTMDMNIPSNVYNDNYAFKYRSDAEKYRNLVESVYEYLPELRSY